MHGVDTVLNVVGSVALLLWGVRMVRTGLTRAFGATLRRAIAACSRNRFTAFAGGLGLTGLLQSSTATSLLVSSFAGRGLIPLDEALWLMIRDTTRYAKRQMTWFARDPEIRWLDVDEAGGIDAAAETVLKQITQEGLTE